MAKCDSYRTWYGRKQLELLAPFDDKNVIVQNAHWTKGVEVSFTWHKGKGILLSLFPSESSCSFIFDGRAAQLYVKMRKPTDRFNQKRFDEEHEYWKPLFKMFATLYLLYGHEEIEKFRSTMQAVNIAMGIGRIDSVENMLTTVYNSFHEQLLGEPYAESHTEQTINENTNNQKQDEMEEPKSLCIALTECEGNSAEMEAVASRIGASIKNGGKSIYNGNDEEIDVPQLFKTAELHPKYVHREQEFGGWLNAKHIKMIDFGKCGTEQRHDLLKQHFDSKTFQTWLDCRKEFDNASTVAIHVDDTDGSWYEYITNGTTPALEEDAA